MRANHPLLQFLVYVVLLGFFVALAIFTGLRANVALPEIEEFDAMAPIQAAPHRQTGEYVIVVPYAPPMEGFMVLGGTPSDQVDVTRAIDLWHPVREYIPEVNTIVRGLNREMSGSNWTSFWALVAGAVTSACGAIVSWHARLDTRHPR